MFDRKPKDAIKLHIVTLNKCETNPEENVLLEDGLYRYLYQPAEQKIRVTDFTWSKNTYRLDRSEKGLGNLVFYYLKRTQRRFCT